MRLTLVSACNFFTEVDASDIRELNCKSNLQKLNSKPKIVVMNACMKMKCKNNNS